MLIQKWLAAMEDINHVILGKRRSVALAMTCLMAQGHLLIEDRPGVGKTTLAQALAASLGLSMKRIQFTSDLLPGDILGTSVYSRQSEGFHFHSGPIFSQVVLADEINRAMPKTQSAMLQAMEEGYVSIDGVNHDLKQPFLVIATQNPREQDGTFPLPESQLDRFLMRIHLGYPDPEAEKQLLRGTGRNRLVSAMQPSLNAREITTLQRHLEKVYISDALLDYVLALLHHSRNQPQGIHGLSPRAGLGLVRVARAWALMHERNHVLPEDVQAVFVSIAAHRIAPRENHQQAQILAQNLLRQVDVEDPGN